MPCCRTWARRYVQSISCRSHDAAILERLEPGDGSKQEWIDLVIKSSLTADVHLGELTNYSVVVVLKPKDYGVHTRPTVNKFWKIVTEVKGHQGAFSVHRIIMIFRWKKKLDFRVTQKFGTPLGLKLALESRCGKNVGTAGSERAFDFLKTPVRPVHMLHDVK